MTYNVFGGTLNPTLLGLLLNTNVYVRARWSCADTNADPKQCTPGTATATGVCHEHAACTQVTSYVCACNPASSYRCECNQGYIGDGLNCTGEANHTCYFGEQQNNIRYFCCRKYIVK